MKERVMYFTLYFLCAFVFYWDLSTKKYFLIHWKSIWLDVLTGKEVGFQALNSVGGDVKIAPKDWVGEMALKVVKYWFSMV